MAVGSVTLQQVLRHPYVIKVLSRIGATTTPLSAFYGLGAGSPASMVIPAGMRSFTYDIFDHSRQLASVRPAEAGPKRVRKQRIGVGSGTLLRSYEAMQVTYEQIANLRPLGSPVGTLDRNGQSYVTRQIAYETERMRNLREWVVSRMFRGGFGIAMSGDDHYVVEAGQGQIQVSYQLPASNTGSLPVGDAAANIISAPWSTPSTDIITQLLNLNKSAERLTGMPIEHIWINSTTLGWILNNTKFQAAGGTSFRVWDSLEWKSAETVSGETRRRGFDVRIRAIPWVTFHVYDGVLAPGTAQVDTIPAADTDVELLIPNNRAIFTPAPGPWCGYATGTEIIQRTIASAPEQIVGFDTWQRPMLDPFGRELLFLDNFFPCLFIPSAVFYATLS